MISASTIGLLQGAPRIPIGRLCSLQNGRAFKPTEWVDAGTPIIRIQNLNDSSKDFNYYSGDLPERFRVRRGDVLLSWSGTPGTSFGCFRWKGPDGWLNQHIFNVRLNPEIIQPDYFVLHVNAILSELIGKAHGGVGLRHITKGQLDKIELSVPSLEVQSRIVDLLSRSENIVRMRREAEQKAKEIIPALFLDTFGDPAKNPKGWPVKPLAVLVRNLDSARKPVRAADRAQMAGRYPYYGASGIIDHVNGYTHEENALLVAEDGANLLSRSTPIAFQASGRYWVNNHAHVLGHAGVAELTFLECSLNLRDLREYITGSAQPKLTQAALLSIPIAVAPVAAQASFARRLSSMDVVVSDQQKAFGCAEQVFQSLLTGVFSEGVAS